MDSVLEKITLYDILGYLFPGSVFIALIASVKLEYVVKLLQEAGDHVGILYVFYFMISYLAGLVLSEIIEVILWLIQKIISFIQKKCKNGGKAYKNKEEELFEEKIVSALKKSGISDSEKDVKDNLKNGYLKYYMRYMYGVVQSSSEFKRIHNYSSAFVMYRNMAVAIFLGTIIILVLCENVNKWFYGTSFFVAILLFIRCCRFLEKKNSYTRIWFISKFLGNEPE